MYSRPEVWNALMAKLADLTTVFLRAQVGAGVDAMTVVDQQQDGRRRPEHPADPHDEQRDSRAIQCHGDAQPGDHQHELDEDHPADRVPPGGGDAPRELAGTGTGVGESGGRTAHAPHDRGVTHVTGSGCEPHGER